MPTSKWSDALALGLPLMDDTHEEFFQILAALIAAPDSEVVEHWSELVTHTHAHFAREDQWMKDTGFSSTNCHISQHHAVLEVMRETLARGRAGETTLVRQVAHELGSWFPQHVQGMDAALALHLRGVGYDAATGVVHMPQALPAQALSGCGSAACSPAGAAVEAAEAAETA
jgi:hemerythrin-like metal-binding protein